MKNFKLNINERIEVLFNDKEYKSSILNISEDYLYISIPICSDEYLIINTDEVIEINVYLENGRCYKFNSKILYRGKEGNISYYKLSKPFNVERIQRRDYFRVEVIEKVQYVNLSELDSDETPYIQADMIDLSGSGVKLKINEKVKIEDILLIKMKIKNSDIVLKGQVMRTFMDNNDKTICGIKFIDITQAQTDKIIEELFLIMRKQRELT